MNCGCKQKAAKKAKAAPKKPRAAPKKAAPKKPRAAKRVKPVKAPNMSKVSTSKSSAKVEEPNLHRGRIVYNF